MTVEEEQAQAAPVAPQRTPGHRATVLLAVLFAAGLALFWLPLRGVRLGAMNGYGLISVLPVATLAGAFVLVVTFFLTLGQSRQPRVLLALQLAATVFMLHGLAPALEPIARPPTAWQHAGFVEYLTRTGGVDVALDPRFSWPGFFAMIAYVAKVGGITDIEPLLHWAPVVSELLYAVAYYLILRVMWANWRAKWFAVWLLVAADWVGQDYFSPQGFAYLLYLLFLGILLNWFMPTDDDAPWQPRKGFFGRLGSGLRTPGERQLGSPGPREQTVVLLLLLLIFMACTASHQLTPYLMLFACAGLVLVRRCTLRGLPILLGIVIAAWVSFMAKSFWAGNSDSLFSGIGNLLGNLTGGVNDRVSTGSPQLATIQKTRILIAVVVVSLAFLGLYRRRRWRFDDRVAMVLLFVPFLSMGLQNYGGEITLRVYFFILPGACLMAAYLFFPTAFTKPRPLRAVGAATVCGLLIASGFLFVRFGNENFEQVRPGAVEAVRTMLRDTPSGRVNMVWLGAEAGKVTGDQEEQFPMAPWGLERMERFDYTLVHAPRNPADITPIVQALKDQPGGYFFTTRGNEAYYRDNFGLPRTYADQMRAALNKSPELRLVLHNPDADLYALRTPINAPPPQVRKATPFTIGSTTWTPVGIIAVLLLVTLITTREIARIQGRIGGPGEAHPVLRGFGFAIPPLLLIAIFVIIERFHTLG